MRDAGKLQAGSRDQTQQDFEASTWLLAQPHQSTVDSGTLGRWQTVLRDFGGEFKLEIGTQKVSARLAKPGKPDKPRSRLDLCK